MPTVYLDISGVITACPGGDAKRRLENTLHRSAINTTQPGRITFGQMLVKVHTKLTPVSLSFNAHSTMSQHKSLSLDSNPAVSLQFKVDSFRQLPIAFVLLDYVNCMFGWCFDQQNDAISLVE